MKTLDIHTTKDNQVQVEVSFRSQFSGYGHYKIFCDVDYNGNKKTFTQTTNNMPWIDSLSDFKHENNPSWEEETEYYLEEFQYDFEEIINEWVDELIEEEEEI